MEERIIIIQLSLWKFKSKIHTLVNKFSYIFATGTESIDYIKCELFSWPLSHSVESNSNHVSLNI